MECEGLIFFAIYTKMTTQLQFIHFLERYCQLVTQHAVMQSFTGLRERILRSLVDLYTQDAYVIIQNNNIATNLMIPELKNNWIGKVCQLDPSWKQSYAKTLSKLFSLCFFYWVG